MNLKKFIRSIPGYPKSNNPIYLSHLVEKSQPERETSEDASAIEEPSGSSLNTEQSDQDLPEVVSEAGAEDAPIMDSETDDEDDDVGWSFSSPEERVVKEERPVIGSSS